MRDKWRDEGAEAEYEWEDEPVSLQLYSDHRRGDLDSYPIIAVCDECAAELGGELGGCAGPGLGTYSSARSAASASTTRPT